MTGLLITTGDAHAVSGPDATRYTAAANADDTFSRTTSSGLGSANQGGAWSAAPTTATSVSPGAARLRLPAPGARVSAALAAVSARDEKVRAVLSVPALPPTGGTSISVAMRRQADGSRYLARVRVAPNGALALAAYRVNGTTRTMLGTEKVLATTVRAGQRFRLEGWVTRGAEPSLSMRAWLDGTAAPAPQVVRVDGASSAITRTGTIGVDAYYSGGSGSTAVSVHAFTGWALTAAPTAQSATTTTSSGVGAPALGSTHYAVPAGAVFVAPAGKDTNPGTQAAPVRTLARAVALAPSRGTVVMRAGSYNQYVFLTKSVTIQNYPGEVVWLDGSVPVSGWTKSGSTWVHTGWTSRFDSSASYTKGSNAGGFINPKYPLAAHPDMVFRDGVALRQVSGTPAAGQFSVNYTAHTLTIGSDPTGHALRASTVQQALIASAGNVTLRGIGVRRYATSLPQMATVYLGGSTGNDVLRDVVFEDNATQSVHVATSNVRLDHVTIRRSGMTGLSGNRAANLTVTNALIERNNAEHFNTNPASAGIKVSRTTGITVAHSRVADNIDANGIWTDISTTNFRFVDNVVVNNPVYGIVTELSENGVIADNRISGSSRGYTVFNTGHVQVYNNTFDNNRVWDVGVTMDARRSGDPACPWKSQYITVSNNLFGRNAALGAGSFQFYALDKQSRTSADAMRITIKGNVFSTKSSSAVPTPIGWGGGDNVTVTSYPSVSTFDAAKAVTNASRTGVDAMTAPVGAYTPTGVAVPLPTAVATAVGVAAGIRHIGVF